MKSFFRNLLLSTAILASGSAAAVESDLLSPYLTEEEASKQFVVDFGVGAFVNQRYDGSDEYLIYPLPLIAISRFYLPYFGQVKDTRDRGVFLYPSFNYVDGRSANDDPSLAGTNSVNWAGEIGLGGGFRQDWFRVFLEVRHGFNGHTGWVGRGGVDFIYQPMEGLALSIGPRVDAADSSFMQTYFSTPSTAVVGPFRAGGGFKSVGAVARASYEAFEDVTFHLQLGYDRLVGDAADSPITLADDQFSAALGATYRFAFDLFD